MTRTPRTTIIRRLMTVQVEAERLWTILHESRPIMPGDRLTRYVKMLRRADTLQRSLSGNML